jgi:hypothetical protein
LHFFLSWSLTQKQISVLSIYYYFFGSYLIKKNIMVGAIYFFVNFFEKQAKSSKKNISPKSEFKKLIKSSFFVKQRNIRRHFF